MPVIWFDRDYDWLDLASVMEYKLRRSAVYFEKYGHHVGSDLDARRMRVCAQILKRLQDDDYFENAQKRFGDTRQAADFASKQSKNDKLYLGMLIGKYLNHWWD